MSMKGNSMRSEMLVSINDYDQELYGQMEATLEEQVNRDGIDIKLIESYVKRYSGFY